ncbi:hypothetical protein [Sphingomonas sp. ERG5]|uniref:hypothetical protein n=1 Tax=Sphingomonas sp. ERG5 TaxID=1381597 RepID=UPI00054B64FD|nr:hypothetical protein [Sphingomonas sp. ERG5]
MPRRQLSPADREHLALPILGRRPQRRPADLADIACAIGALLIAVVLAVVAVGSDPAIINNPDAPAVRELNQLERP